MFEVLTSLTVNLDVKNFFVRSEMWVYGLIFSIFAVQLSTQGKLTAELGLDKKWFATHFICVLLCRVEGLLSRGKYSVENLPVI